MFNFGEELSTEEVLIKRIDEAGFRPATLYEMLKWADKNWNRKDCVVAFGSSWVDQRGRRFVPFLYGYGSERSLSLGIKV